MSATKPFSKNVLDAVLALQQLIDNKPLDPLNVPDFYRSRQIGSNLFKMAFKQQTGVTISRYRLVKRMVAASEMLKEKGLTIKRIALKCGYANQTNFSADFKKIFGKTPTEWRREANKHWQHA